MRELEICSKVTTVIEILGIDIWFGLTLTNTIRVEVDKTRAGSQPQIRPQASLVC